MRGPIAILCSGQGAQHSRMFDLCRDMPASEPIFIAAGELLGEDPRRFVVEAAPETLFADYAGQLLCCTQALALWATLGVHRLAHIIIAGYSVGEVAAWGCAGAFNAADALRLVQRRASIMDAAAPAHSGLAGIIGLTREALDAILLRHGAAIAIINDTRSFVIGGVSDALDACCNEATASGATRAVKLRVSVPSHTSLLAGAVTPFDAALKEVAPRRPPATYRLLSGIDGGIVQDMASACDKLSRQISTTVDWAACLESCRESGAELVLELGPGRALSHMAASLFPEGRVRSAEDFHTVSGLRSWLGC
jgi:[acyl-carrier-protein] S-malonyltransferase